MATSAQAPSSINPPPVPESLRRAAKRLVGASRDLNRELASYADQLEEHGIMLDIQSDNHSPEGAQETS